MKRKKKHLTSLDYFRHNIKWFMMVVATIFIAGIFVGPGFGSYGNMSCGGDQSASMTREQYAEHESEVMARLGDKEFKHYTIHKQVNSRIDSYTKSSPGTIVPPEQKLSVIWSTLDQEIEDAFKLIKAKELNLEVTSEEVNKAYEEQKQNIIMRSGLGPDANPDGNESLLHKADRRVQSQKAERAFLSLLSSQFQLTPKQFKDLIRDNILKEKYTEKLNEEAAEQVKSDAKKESTEIYNRIVSEGEDFAEIATSDSDDGSSSTNGGLVENMTRKDAKAKSDEYATSLFTAEIDKVLEPLEIDGGFYILKVESRILAEGDDFENAKADIIAEIKVELGITDEVDEKLEVVEYSDEALMEMASSEGIDDEPVKSEDQITDYMIKERYETVTFRQIFIRPENAQTQYQANIKALKAEAGIEIVDPLMKAYSYVADYENRDFDSAIEGFRAIRAERVQTLDEAKVDFQEKSAEYENATEDNRIQLLDETTYFERSIEYANSNLAEINYIIAFYMQEKINSIEQEMNESDEEPDTGSQAIIDELRIEMRTLIAESVASEPNPNPYYSAMLGDLQITAGEFAESYDNWAHVADYGYRDLTLLQRSETAFNLFLDSIEDEETRTQAGKDFDKLQKHLDKALEDQRKQQEEWQAQMQKMIEQQMAEQEGGSE